jgi:hypothetical protein
MTILKRAMAIAVAVLLAGCTAGQGFTPPPGQKMQVSQRVLDYYHQEYLPQVGSVNQAAFAVSQSGRMAGFSYCPDTHCKSGSTVGQDAIHECQANGDSCYVFALGSAIKVDYEVMP